MLSRPSAFFRANSLTFLALCTEYPSTEPQRTSPRISAYQVADDLPRPQPGIKLSLPRAASGDNRVQLRQLRRAQPGTGPDVFFVSSAARPPWSYFCCHRKSIARETLNILAIAAASFLSLRS